MSPTIDVNLTDNSKLVLDALDSQIEQALIAMGMTAETYAKKPLADGGYMPVDTGRLKNSITFALAGQPANTSTYRADFTRYKTKTGKTAIRKKRVKSWTYKGKAPADPGGKPRSVYIGSNVEYAEVVEEGTSGRTARHYLRHAITDHVDEYKKLAEAALKGQDSI